MDIQTLTQFFMWCTIMGAGLLLLWTLFLIFAPDLTYRTQSKFFPISQDTFTIVMYSLLGAYKIILLIFVVIPFIALLIVG